MLGRTPPRTLARPAEPGDFLCLLFPASARTAPERNRKYRQTHPFYRALWTSVKPKPNLRTGNQQPATSSPFALSPSPHSRMRLQNQLEPMPKLRWIDHFVLIISIVHAMNDHQIMPGNDHHVMPSDPPGRKRTAPKSTPGNCLPPASVHHSYSYPPMSYPVILPQRPARLAEFVHPALGHVWDLPQAFPAPPTKRVPHPFPRFLRKGWEATLDQRRALRSYPISPSRHEKHQYPSHKSF